MELVSFLSTDPLIDPYREDRRCKDTTLGLFVCLRLVVPSDQISSAGEKNNHKKYVFNILFADIWVNFTGEGRGYRYRLTYTHGRGVEYISDI